MTQYLSRKERRDAERSGIPVEMTSPQSTQPEEPVIQAQSFTSPLEFKVAEVEPVRPAEAKEDLFVSEAISVSNVANVSASPLSRRELRNAERSGKPVVQTETSPVVETPTTTSSFEIDAFIDLTATTTSNVLAEEPVTFTGTNLLAEPSTQSIVLDVVPEAVSLPIEITGEIVSTGSIAVIPDSTAAVVTATMDGSQLDQVAMKDAVTGVISVVEPVSALAVISEREDVGVVPEAALRKGWWIKWLIGLGALVMTAAAIWATLTILELIGN